MTSAPAGFEVSGGFGDKLGFWGLAKSKYVTNILYCV